MQSINKHFLLQLVTFKQHWTDITEKKLFEPILHLFMFCLFYAHPFFISFPYAL